MMLPVGSPLGPIELPGCRNNTEESSAGAAGRPQPTSSGAWQLSGCASVAAPSYCSHRCILLSLPSVREQATHITRRLDAGELQQVALYPVPLQWRSLLLFLLHRGTSLGTRYGAHYAPSTMFASSPVRAPFRTVAESPANQRSATPLSAVIYLGHAKLAKTDG